MNYRSLADMHDTIVQNLHRLGRDTDLVVGIPRSGLLAANLISLLLNAPMADLDGFLAGRVLHSGFTKRRQPVAISDMRRILVVDDSIYSGTAMAHARQLIEAAGLSANVIYCAIYGARQKHADVDLVLDVVPHPRVFQWNLMHHSLLEFCCVDVDGVLCHDPTEAENDDGQQYQAFLRTARPLLAPSQKIGWLVTSRLEKYRDQTEGWLAAHGIIYGELVMLDLPSKAERQRLAAHATFKADFYGACADALLFIESNSDQARRIADATGKAVLCVEDQAFYRPGISLEALATIPLRMQLATNPLRRHFSQLKASVRRLLGERMYRHLKRMVVGQRTEA